MPNLETRLFEDPVIFAHLYFEAMGWGQYKAITDLEEEAIRFAAGLDTPPEQMWRLVDGFRAMGKTRLITITQALWRLYRDPERRIVFVSQSAEFAWKMLITTRQSCDKVPFLRHLRPRNGQRDSRTQFDVGPSSVNPQPSCMALGIEGQLAGIRAHSIFADDIETEENCKTLVGRDELEAKCDNFATWLYPNRAKGQSGASLALDPVEIVMPGTAKHDDDSLYHRLPRRSVVVKRSYPIVYPRIGDFCPTLAPHLAKRLQENPNLANQCTTKRFTTDEAHFKMSQFLPSTENREYRLLVGSSSHSAYPLRLDDLIVADWHLERDKGPIRVVWGMTDHNGTDTAIEGIPVLAPTTQRLRRPVFRDPKWALYDSTKAFCDPSGTGDDRTGLAIVSHLAGTFYLKALVGLEGGPTDFDTIASLCRLHGATELSYERNADVTSTWSQFMRAALNRYACPQGDPVFPDGWSCSLTPRHHQQQKELRIISTLRPILQHHRLVVARDIVQPTESTPDREFQYQLARITEKRHSLREDGKIDALAGCLASWTSESSILIPNQADAAIRSTEASIQSLMRDRDSLTGKRQRHWMMKRWGK